MRNFGEQGRIGTRSLKIYSIWAAPEQCIGLDKGVYKVALSPSPKRLLPALFYVRTLVKKGRHLLFFILSYFFDCVSTLRTSN